MSDRGGGAGRCPGGGGVRSGVDGDLEVLGAIGAGASHRDAASVLVLAGWVLCGAGDWAVALRSPGGRLVARVCPFDPAYEGFVELVRRCPGNPYLPRVEHHRGLRGGGTLTVLEHLPAAPPAAAAALVERWHAGEDPVLRALRTVAEAVDEECRARVPWWDGMDLNAGNVRRTEDGQPVLLDVFCLDGRALYDQVLADAAVVRARVPASEHLLEIPYLAREFRVGELAAVRAAWDGPRRSSPA